MKFVKLIRPLFLVAVGLHGLALFVPIGPQEAAVIEDVDIAALENTDRDDVLTDRAVGPLPVPDPNVQAVPNAAGKTGIKPAIPAASPAPVARRRPAAAVAVRPTAPTARRPVTNPSATAATATSGAPARPSSSQSSTTTSNSSDASNRTPEESSATAGEISQGESFLSTVNLPDSSDSDSNTNASAATEGTVTVAALLAEITQNLPSELLETVTRLEKSLTYSAENTDDASAQKNRSDWKTKIQRQANVGTISSIEQTESAILTQINYPIESSAQTSDFMQGRNINLCLDEPKPGKAEVGVLFDASGNVVDQPELLRSTGYGAVDEEIKAIAATQEHFPRDRNSKAYSFEVEVNYDEKACVSLSDLKA